MIYSESLPSYEYLRQSNNHHSQDDINNPPILTLGDKLPLSMLLCLLADGRQLTLEEIDRVFVYLLEKKAKMLTLPPGTLPPLPAQYATAFNEQTGALLLLFFIYKVFLSQIFPNRIIFYLYLFYKYSNLSQNSRINEKGEKNYNLLHVDTRDTSIDWRSLGIFFLSVSEWRFGMDILFSTDRKSTRLNSSHERLSRMPSSA